MVEPDFIPSTPLDLVVLRDKFVEAVRRHLLAEVTLAIIFYLVYLGGGGGGTWKWEGGHTEIAFHMESVIFLSPRDRVKRFFNVLYFLVSSKFLGV